MNKFFKTWLLAVIGCLAPGLSAQTTLASWTFEGGYEQTSESDGKIVKLTPNGGEFVQVPVTWFNTAAPVVLPDECVGDNSAYSLSAMSAGRFWQVCEGYQNHVLRIENSDPNEITDFTDASKKQRVLRGEVPHRRL